MLTGPVAFLSLISTDKTDETAELMTTFVI